MNTIQTNPALNSAAANSLLGSQASKAAANGDFMAMFMQMLTGGGEGSGDGLSGLNFGDEETSPEENSAAMEMAAGLLSGNYGFDWLLSGGMENNELSYSGIAGQTGMSQTMASMGLDGLNGSSGEENSLNGLMNTDNSEMFGSENSGSKLLSQMMLMQKAQDIITAYNAQTNQTNQSSQLNQGILGTASEVTPLNPLNTSNKELGNQNFLATAGINGEEIQNISVKIAQNDETSSDMLYNGDMNFKTAIAKAQRMMKEPSSDNDDKSFNIDAMGISAAQASDTASVNATSGNPQKVASIDMDDLSEQIAAGLSKGELTEKKEISVKLRPEGLGDVTIKLIKEANQIKISIVAASEQTSRLLNDNLPTLRQTMRLSGTEVNDVVVTRQDDFNQQGTFGNQMFMGQQNEQQSAHHSGTAQRGNGYYSDGNDDILTNQQKEPQYAQSGMKIYA